MAEKSSATAKEGTEGILSWAVALLTESGPCHVCDWHQVFFCFDGAGWDNLYLIWGWSDLFYSLEFGS